MSREYRTRATSFVEINQSEAQGSFSYSRSTAGQQEHSVALSAQQENLADAREQLLIDREEVLAQRKELRKRRIQTGDAEIELMNAFRRVFVQIALPVPPSLLSAYKTAEIEHQALRALEEESFEAEDDLGASEWDFMDLENDFYQTFVPGPLSKANNDSSAEHTEGETITQAKGELILPTPPVEYHTLVSKHSRLVTRFEALRRTQGLSLNLFGQINKESGSGFSDIMDVDDETSKLASDLLDMIGACETRMQQLEPDLNPFQANVSCRPRQLSQPDMEHDLLSDQVETVSRACSEGVAPSVYVQGLFEELFERWSLRALASSALERLLYINILRHELNVHEAQVMNFEEWKHEISRTWFSDHSGRLRLPELDGSINAFDIDFPTRSDVQQVQKCGESISAGRSASESLSSRTTLNMNAPSSFTSTASVFPELDVPLIYFDVAPGREACSPAGATGHQLSGITNAHQDALENVPRMETEMTVQGSQQAMSIATSLKVSDFDTGSHKMKRCDSAHGLEDVNNIMEVKSEGHSTQINNPVFDQHGQHNQTARQPSAEQNGNAAQNQEDDLLSVLPMRDNYGSDSIQGGCKLSSSIHNGRKRRPSFEPLISVPEAGRSIRRASSC